MNPSGVLVLISSQPTPNSASLHWGLFIGKPLWGFYVYIILGILPQLTQQHGLRSNRYGLVSCGILPNPLRYLAFPYLLPKNIKTKKGHTSVQPFLYRYEVNLS